MPIWMAEPRDVIRLPASYWPRVVTVTDAEGTSLYEHTRLHWAAVKAHGSIVLPDGLDVDLLWTDRLSKRVFATRNLPGGVS